MRFKKHSDLNGKHAFLSPSYYHWTRYTTDRLESRWRSFLASLIGTEQHSYAAHAIENGIVQDGNSMLDRYINDCIGFKMRAEVVLFYSNNCFGTADAIVFRYKKLRISDLKTGVSKTSDQQLIIYAAIFCLEYDVDPYDIKTELRIYQSDEIRLYEPHPSEIVEVMEKIIIFDKQINRLKREGVTP